MTLGRIIAVLGVIAAILLALLFVVYPDLSWILPVAAAAEAKPIDDLFRLMLAVSVVLFVGVQGLLIYFVWIFRLKPDEPEDAVGSSLHGDNRLEISWTVLPALFLVVLTILSLRAMDDLGLRPGLGEREIGVEARQFAWTFNHPETGIVESGRLTLELGVPVTLAIGAVDVNHAFWVPEFRVKQDATPGFTRYITITPTKTHREVGYDDPTRPGFPLRCAEFCGIGHSAMLARVLVLDSAEYARWEAEAIAQAAESPGRAIYVAQGCGGCHALEAIGAVGVVGPTHNNLAEIAGQRVNDAGYTGTAQTAQDYLKESIRTPGAYVVPGFGNVMQAYGPDSISDEELDQLVDWLLDPRP